MTSGYTSGSQTVTEQPSVTPREKSPSSSSRPTKRATTFSTRGISAEGQAVLTALSNATAALGREARVGVDLYSAIPKHKLHASKFCTDLTTFQGSGNQLMPLLKNPALGPVLFSYLRSYNAQVQTIMTNASYLYEAKGIDALAKQLGLQKLDQAQVQQLQQSDDKVSALKTVVVPSVGVYQIPNMVDSFYKTLQADKTSLTKGLTESVWANDIQGATANVHAQGAIKAADSYLSKVNAKILNLAGGYTSKLQDLAGYPVSLSVSAQSELRNLKKLSAELAKRLQTARDNLSELNNALKTKPAELSSSSSMALAESLSKDVTTSIGSFSAEPEAQASSQAAAASLARIDNRALVGLQYLTSTLIPNRLRAAADWAYRRSLGNRFGIHSDFPVPATILSTLSADRDALASDLRASHLAQTKGDADVSLAAMMKGAYGESASDKLDSVLALQLAHRENILAAAGQSVAAQTALALQAKKTDFDLAEVAGLKAKHFAKPVARDLSVLALLMAGATAVRNFVSVADAVPVEEEAPGFFERVKSAVGMTVPVEKEAPGFFERVKSAVGMTVPVEKEAPGFFERVKSAVGFDSNSSIADEAEAEAAKKAAAEAAKKAAAEAAKKAAAEAAKKAAAEAAKKAEAEAAKKAEAEAAKKAEAEAAKKAAAEAAKKAEAEAAKKAAAEAAKKAAAKAAKKAPEVAATQAAVSPKPSTTKAAVPSIGEAYSNMGKYSDKVFASSENMSKNPLVTAVLAPFQLQQTVLKGGHSLYKSARNTFFGDGSAAKALEQNPQESDSALKQKSQESDNAPKI